MTRPEDPSPTAVKMSSAFRMECAVSCTIAAPPGRVWSLLTDAAGFPRWNSTVTRIDGEIAPGQKLELRVPAAPTRVFKPRVTGFEPGKSMVWSDGFAPMFRGVRTFSLTARGERGEATEFSMREVFSGVMLPMIRGSLPDFAPSFEAYARDLKRESERSV